MRRVFGSKKPVYEGPGLDEATERIEGRSRVVEDKIKKLDQELITIRQQLAKTRPGPAQNGLKQKAMRTLKQKKMYEAQLYQMMDQGFNMEQANFAQQTMQDTITTVGAMKQGAAQMKQTFKQMNIDEIENLHDDMQDLLDQNEEIQDVLGRSFGLGDEIDEDDLEMELDALGDEWAAEEDEVPSYLAATVPNTEPGQFEAEPLVDEFGLPAVPVST